MSTLSGPVLFFLLRAQMRSNKACASDHLRHLITSRTTVLKISQVFSMYRNQTQVAHRIYAHKCLLRTWNCANQETLSSSELQPVPPKAICSSLRINSCRDHSHKSLKEQCVFTEVICWTLTPPQHGQELLVQDRVQILRSLGSKPTPCIFKVARFTSHILFYRLTSL